MIEFPQAAQAEWDIIAKAANAEAELRHKIHFDVRVADEAERLRLNHYGKLAFQAELDAGLTPSLEMMTLDAYTSSTIAGPSDLIDGVLKAEGLCIMLGPSSSGKSTKALQMVHSLMTGEDWLGQPVQQISGAVGIMSYDMDGSLVADWMRGFPNVDASKISIVNAYKQGNPLNVPEFRARIAAAWRAMGTEVVIIDSFSASFFGQDQNDAASTQQYYRDMKMFAFTEVGARALIVIVHSTESNPIKARGSTVQHDVADSIVAVSVDSTTSLRTVRMVKYRQHRGAAGAMTSQMTPVIVSAPDSVTHLVGLDLGAMTLAGMQIPASAGAAGLFPNLPTPNSTPDTDSDSGEDDL